MKKQKIYKPDGSFDYVDIEKEIEGVHKQSEPRDYLVTLLYLFAWIEVIGGVYLGIDLISKRLTVFGIALIAAGFISAVVYAVLARILKDLNFITAKLHEK